MTKLGLVVATLGLSCITDDVMDENQYPPLLDDSLDNWKEYPFCNWQIGPQPPEGMYSHDICVCQNDAASPACDGRNVDWADEALVERYHEQPGCREPPLELHRACYWTPDQDGEDESIGRCCYCARMVAECYPIPF